jgi:hypothetical protein
MNSQFLAIPSLVEKPNQIYCKGMSTIEARIASFENWPTNTKQKPNELAMCGFFSRGTPDKVVCYYCGLGLRNWLPDDDPWMEHALNSRRCPYLLSYKHRVNFQLKPSDHGGNLQKLLVMKTVCTSIIVFLFFIFLIISILILTGFK